jgi:hypothetical protein
VMQNGLALVYANNTLKADKDIALIAVNQNGLAFAHVSDILKRDKQVIQLAFMTVSNNQCLLNMIPIDFIQRERDFLVQLQLQRTKRLGCLVYGHGEELCDMLIYK